MKKYAVLSVILMLCLGIFCFSVSMYGATAQNKIIVNGETLNLDVQPINIEGRVLVPLRGVFEALGGTVEWNPLNGGSVKCVKGNITIELQINNKLALVNGSTTMLDVSAQIINNRTMVPLRFVSEKMGADVIWDAENKSVLINYTDTNTKREIPIGVNLELTGQISPYGESVLNGIKQAVHEINRNGGISGSNIQLIIRDNESNCDKATQVASELTDEGVVSIIGPCTGMNYLPMVPVITEKRVPTITPTCSYIFCTVEPNGSVREYAFRTCFVDSFQGTIAAKFAKDSLKAKTAGIVYDTESSYSNELQGTFVESFKSLGGKVINVRTIKTWQKDFGDLCKEIAEANPDVLFVPLFYSEGGPLIRQLREQGYKNPIIGGDGFDTSYLAELVGKNNVEKVYFITHFAVTDSNPKINKFKSGYFELYNEHPNAFAALGYDTVYLLADAINRAGSSDKTKIKKALANTKDFNGVTGKLAIDSQHNPVRTGFIFSFNKNSTMIFIQRVDPF